MEPNTKRDGKSEETLLKRKVSKERGTTFDNISEPGNFDTSRIISFGIKIGTKRETVLDEMSAFQEAIKVKIIQCSICFESWFVKLKPVS